MDSIKMLELKENFDRELRLSVERWRTMPKEEQDKKSREFYEFAKHKFMEKLDDSVVTRKLLDLTKKEIKSDITTLRLETKQMSEQLRTEMSQLKKELRSEMSQLKEELRSEMTQLKQELRSDMALLTQKMETNTAKLLVAIEEQNNNWKLLFDHYGQIYANQTDHTKRLERLEMSSSIPIS